MVQLALLAHNAEAPKTAVKRIIQDTYPVCIQEKIAQFKRDTSSRVMKPPQFINRYALKDGRTIYAFKVAPAGNNCYDCARGVFFTDSLCTPIGTFIMGRVYTEKIAPGYTKEDFRQTRLLSFNNNALKK